MTEKLNALPKGSVVLVTGANGYIATAIIDELLQLGIKVKGTVRTEKPWLEKLFADKYGSGFYESVVVPDLGDKEAVDEALDGVSGVVLVVSIRPSGST